MGRGSVELEEMGGKYEAGLLEFFGSRAAAQQFESMTDHQQMIQFIWKAPQFQVKYVSNRHYKLNYNL